MAVPDEPHTYVVGEFEPRVTLYAQQIRGLNLIHALFQEGRLGSRWAGCDRWRWGGGMSAAAGAAVRGCQVTLLESQPSLLSMQSGNRTRWIHPHIFDWPDTVAETDGKLDIASADGGPNTVSVLLGKGDGAFQDQTVFPVGASPFSLTTGDFGRDGRLRC